MNCQLQYRRDNIFDRQNNALRDPAEILSGVDGTNGQDLRHSLQFTATESFVEVLDRLKITLFVSREYEHLVLALTVRNGAMGQSFVRLPHPSGLAVNRDENSIFVATTRNPNQVWEFKPATRRLERIDRLIDHDFHPYLLPVRVKYLPGAYYLHDLAIIGGRLYGTSVGQNSIVRLDLDHNHFDEAVWWPKCVEAKGGAPDRRANFIQLNSIASCQTLKGSFFSASSSGIARLRPGHLNYPVDRKGVIFSGRTRDVCATGLTRPHSARFFRNKIWVDNSGYGEVGCIEDGRFIPCLRLPGWTRGLCCIGTVLFVGVSRVLPKFQAYAPGLDERKDNRCGIYALDLERGTTIGSIIWPYGNQVFAIDWMKRSVTEGFPFDNLRGNRKMALRFFYNGIV